MRRVVRPYHLKHPRCQEILSYVRGQQDCLSMNEISTQLGTGYAPVHGCLPLLVEADLLHTGIKAGTQTVTCYKS